MAVLVTQFDRHDRYGSEEQVEHAGSTGDTGVAGAFDLLFAREYPAVVRIAYRVLADAHEAEDVAQEVFVSFHRRHPPDAPWAAAWLHAAAAHTALNAVRSRRRRVRREEEQGHSALCLDDGQTDDPAQTLETGELRREVQAALARLPEKSATVLTLRYSGLSYAEVAAALGVQIGQVGTLLKRAEAALRKEITREYPTFHGIHRAHS